MNVQPKGSSPEGGWTIERAEKLLNSLKGVLSARVVARPGGEIEEIHILTDEKVHPKQTVRNVESALLARFDLTLDHRKISVAQTDEAPAPPAEEEESGPNVASLMLHRMTGEGDEARILLVGHQVETERSQGVRTRVTLEWREDRFTGESVGADVPRVRLEGLATATLDAIQRALRAADEGSASVSLSLEGLKTMEAFDRSYFLVAVHAADGRQTVSLAGAAAVQDSPDRAVILATLQATDRWVRGRATKPNE